MAVPSLLLVVKMCPLCITDTVPVLFNIKADTICSSELQSRPVFIVAVSTVIILVKNFSSFDQLCATDMLLWMAGNLLAWLCLNTLFLLKVK